MSDLKEVDWNALHRWKRRQTQKADWARLNPVSLRLQRKLIAMGYNVERPERLFKAGYAEAWSWQVGFVDSSVRFGSQFSMRECLKMSDADLEKCLDV